jgi:hypothetical protein
MPAGPKKILIVLTSANKLLSKFSPEKMKPPSNSEHQKLYTHPLTLVLIFFSLVNKSDDKGATGWYLPELAHPYYVFKDEFDLTFASPAGGEAPLDPVSLTFTLYPLIKTQSN